MPLIAESLILCTIAFLLGVGASALLARRLRRRRERQGFLWEDR